MKLLLNEFEHQINEIILQRGFDYFKEGRVTNMDELGNGDYEITVEGSETYTVRLSIEDDAVTEFRCDCPYDGPVCKHVVAALFYLQRNVLNALEVSAKKMQNKQKKMSVAEQAEKLLDTMSHDALKAFVHKTCVTDHKFRELFVAKHIHLLYPESKELYTKQLQAFIKTCTGDYDFIDYRGASRLGNMVYGMVDEAMDSLENGKFREPMYVAAAILEEMADLINCNVDDSGGQIGGAIEGAFSILNSLAESGLTEVQRGELFDYLLSIHEKKMFKGWDWYFNTIALAIDVLKTDQEKERIKSALGKIKPNGQSWDWDYNKAQELMLQLIKKTESNEAVVQFIESNLSNSRFRAELIEIALAAKNYKRVEELAHEGIAKDEKEHPGLADDWRDYLLTVYRQTGDVENTIQLARYFVIYSIGHQHPLKYYYDLLKSLIPQEQWCDYLEELVLDIKRESRWGDYDRVAQLYIWEACWDKLFDILRQEASFDRVVNAEQYLSGFYSAELAALYKRLILEYLKRNVGRNHYQSACRYIQRMIKLGARSMAMELVKELQVLYPTRRALLEELRRF